MLFHELRAVAGRVPSRNGLRYRGTLTPYIELAERAERLAAGLLDRGIGPGMPVALLMSSSPDLFLTSYALFAIGAIAVPLNAAAPARELEVAAIKCAVEAIIARDESVPAAERLMADLKRTLPLIRVSEYESLMRAPQVLPDVSGDAPAAYLFSSGSTGRQKVVPHTHAELIANGINAGGHGVGMTPDDVVLNSLPGHHAFGFFSVQFEALLPGATTVCWSDPQPFMMARGRFLAAIEAEGITVLPGVPFAFDALCGLSDEVDVSSLRVLYSGGVALKKPLYDKFYERFGKRIGQGYGSTEFGLASFSDGSDPEAWDGVGPPLPGTEFSIVNGEVFVRSPHLTKGYLGDPASNAAFVDGGFMTGDLAHLDEQGRLYITGRSKLILEVAGMKVDPVEVEDVFMMHPAVAEAVVVGVPDPRSGEQQLKLVAVLKGDTRPEALVRYGRERLSPHKAPGIVEFIDAIPRSATGKVLRGKLMEG